VKTSERQVSRVKKIECPECGSDVNLSDGVVENEILECTTCGVELEVVSLKPLKVELAPEEEEDWGE
jgi:alpha-aminoadipate carrier protein LysW